MTTNLVLVEPAELTDEELQRIAHDAQLEWMHAHGGILGLDLNGIAQQCRMAALAGHRAVWAAAIAAALARQAATPAQGELRELVACVPVSQKPWEQKGWCDDNGFCWLCNHYSAGRWNYDTPHKAGEDYGPLGNYTHSLPHWFIPRPRPTGRKREGAG